MSDLLMAIARSLAGVPGLAPLFNPLIGIREEEKSRKEHETLIAKMEQGDEVTKELVERVLENVGFLQNQNEWLQEQIVLGFQSVIKLISQSQPEMRASILGSQGQPLPANLTSNISALITADTRLLDDSGLVTTAVMVNAFSNHFGGRIGNFLAIAEAAGFPRARIAMNNPPREAYFDFLMEFEGLSRETQATVSSAIARDRPGVRLFQVWASLFDSETKRNSGQ